MGDERLPTRASELKPPNNSLEPTRDRRAKMEAGLTDVATTRSRRAAADEGAIY